MQDFQSYPCFLLLILESFPCSYSMEKKADLDIHDDGWYCLLLSRVEAFRVGIYAYNIQYVNWTVYVNSIRLQLPNSLNCEHLLVILVWYSRVDRFLNSHWCLRCWCSSCLRLLQLREMQFLVVVYDSYGSDWWLLYEEVLMLKQVESEDAKAKKTKKLVLPASFMWTVMAWHHRILAIPASFSFLFTLNLIGCVHLSSVVNSVNIAMMIATMPASNLQYHGLSALFQTMLQLSLR